MNKTHILLAAATLCTAAITANAEITVKTWQSTTGSAGWDSANGFNQTQWQTSANPDCVNWIALFTNNATGARTATQLYETAGTGNLRMGAIYVKSDNTFGTTITSGNASVRPLTLTSHSGNFNSVGTEYNLGTISNTGTGSGVLTLGSSSTRQDVSIAPDGDGKRYLQVNADIGVVAYANFGTSPAKITELNVTGTGGLTLKTNTALANVEKVSVKSGKLDITAFTTAPTATIFTLDDGIINAGANDIKISSVKGTSTVNGTGGVTLSGNVSFLFEDGSTGPLLTASSVTLDNATFSYTEANLASLSAGVYEIFSGTTTGVFSNEGIILEKYGNTYTLSGNTLTVQAIPEPSTYALLGSLAAAGVALVARRRKRA